MWNGTRIYITAGSFHVYVGWDIPELSQVWSNSLLGRAFPCAARCLASNLSIITTKKAPWKCPNQSLEAQLPRSRSTRLPQPSLGWDGDLEGWQREGTGIRACRRFLVEGGWHPVFLTTRPVPSRWPFTCKVGVDWALFQSLCNLTCGEILFLSGWPSLNLPGVNSRLQFCVPILKVRFTWLLRYYYVSLCLFFLCLILSKDG